MDKKIMRVLPVVLVCIAIAGIMPVVSQTGEPSTPFVINGSVFTTDSNPCNGPTVLITNLDTSDSWYAENASTSNYYQLVLNSTDVSANQILQFNASGCSQSKTVTYTITQSNIDDGGISSFDIMFESSQEIIWQGGVTLTNGTTFNVTAHNSGDSYVLNRTTALGTLDAGAEAGDFNYTVNDEWYATWDSLFVDSIADIPNEGLEGWMYWVNYPNDPMPMVSADQYTLEDDDVVTWYWSSSMNTTPEDSPMLVVINVTVEEQQEPIYGVSITSTATEQATAPDENATYMLTIKNTGNEEDNFALSVDNLDDAAIANLSTYSITQLAANDSTTVLLNVTNAVAGTYRVNLTATSEADASKFDFVNTTTTVGTTPPSVPPVIIDCWYNNKTNDNSLEITVNVSEGLYFNATANQTIDTWQWLRDGVDQERNYNNFTTSWTVAGLHEVSVHGENVNGTSNTIVWNVTVVTESGETPTADYLAIEDASGVSETYVEVPVDISNVRNGPVEGIRLRIDYSENVLNLTSISSSDLTMNWTQLQLGEDGHTIVIGTEYSGDAIQDGSTGTVVLLNFSVLGAPGDTSSMNLSLIEFSDPEGTLGTAPAKNGVFTVSELSTIIAGRITYSCNGTEIAGVAVNLTKEGTVVDTTVTNETGYYIFTDVNSDSYYVNAAKPQFFENSTEVTVIAGESKIVDMVLWLKGDLNNDGRIADAGDVVLMLKASVGDIPGDERYDLNANDVIADAGDVVLLLRASIGDIVLW